MIGNADAAELADEDLADEHDNNRDEEGLDFDDEEDLESIHTTLDEVEDAVASVVADLEE